LADCCFFFQFKQEEIHGMKFFMPGLIGVKHKNCRKKIHGMKFFMPGLIGVKHKNYWRI